MQLQYQRSKDRIYAMNDAGGVVMDFECRHDFFEGFNSEGLERETLPNGLYPHAWAEITNGKYGRSYGTFYITTGDPRGRDIHGGGDGYGIRDPYAPRQGWLPTYGCLRMQNEDGEALSRWMIENGNDMLLEVVDE